MDCVRKYTVRKEPFDGNKLNRPDITYLYRIYADRDIKTQFFDAPYAKRGGLIECSENLAQEGNCWIAEDGIVLDNAKVKGNAFLQSGIMKDSAVLRGNALVLTNTILKDRVIVRDSARIVNSYLQDNCIVSDMAVVIKSCLIGNIEVKDSSIVNQDSVIAGSHIIRGSTYMENFYEDNRCNTDKKGLMYPRELKNICLDRTYSGDKKEYLHSNITDMREYTNIQQVSINKMQSIQSSSPFLIKEKVRKINRTIYQNLVIYKRCKDFEEKDVTSGRNREECISQIIDSIHNLEAIGGEFHIPRIQDIIDLREVPEKILKKYHIDLETIKRDTFSKDCSTTTDLF